MKMKIGEKKRAELEMPCEFLGLPITSCSSISYYNLILKALFLFLSKGGGETRVISYIVIEDCLNDN
jgi:hypothetical protein